MKKILLILQGASMFVGACFIFHGIITIGRNTIIIMARENKIEAGIFMICGTILFSVGLITMGNNKNNQ